jgi:hypothetical protein
MLGLLLGVPLVLALLLEVRRALLLGHARDPLALGLVPLHLRALFLLAPFLEPLFLPAGRRRCVSRRRGRVSRRNGRGGG